MSGMLTSGAIPTTPFNDLKARTHFSKEDRGLLKDWIAAFRRGRALDLWMPPKGQGPTGVSRQAQNPTGAFWARGQTIRVEIGEDGVDVDAAVIARGFNFQSRIKCSINSAQAP